MTFFSAAIEGDSEKIMPKKLKSTINAIKMPTPKGPFPTEPLYLLIFFYLLPFFGHHFIINYYLSIMTSYKMIDTFFY